MHVATNYHGHPLWQDSDDHKIQKRPTVLLNRLVYALQNAIQPDEVVNRQHQELERRGYPKHYWKCYFNAVSCFKRKRQEELTKFLERKGTLAGFTATAAFYKDVLDLLSKRFDLLDSNSGGFHTTMHGLTSPSLMEAA
ncbi:uncharacterized protein CDAR_452521 [Caerostris darwini]|uniref:Uncharacterized protein n=1 Tax=Caerostris darwini TaxID=1538125 RepID=A0AAV4U7Z0_9ARAC|nr:uncharacterized protein CDAR_452521 [Caerostris darwini]